jgi:uncharacterized membrane protein YqjE
MIDRLSTAASIAVRHVGAYTDLILSDLDVASEGVRRRLVATSVMVAAIVLAVVMACVWVMAAAWDTRARLWVIAGLLGFFLAMAAAALWRLNVLEAAAPSVLSQTAREWAKDRKLLEELLARERAEAS